MTSFLQKLLWWSPFGTVPEIDAGELVSRTQTSSNNLKLLDVRTSREWRKGHIKGAMNIPITELHARIKEITADREQSVVFICQMGSRSRPAVWMLRYYGSENGVQLAGGMAEWVRQGLPVETE